MNGPIGLWPPQAAALPFLLPELLGPALIARDWPRPFIYFAEAALLSP